MPPMIPSSPREELISTSEMGLARKAVDGELDDIASHNRIVEKVKGFKGACSHCYLFCIVWLASEAQNIVQQSLAHGLVDLITTRSVNEGLFAPHSRFGL